MSNTVIRVENISKLYRLGEVGTGSLAHDVNRWWHKVRGKEDPYLKIGEVNDRTKPAARAVASSELLVTSENQSASGPATRHPLQRRQALLHPLPVTRHSLLRRLRLRTGSMR